MLNCKSVLMFHDKMNGEKAEDLKKLFGWVKI